jgi:hypothetical protein
MANPFRGTIRAYTDDGALFVAFLGRQRMPHYGAQHPGAASSASLT